MNGRKGTVTTIDVGKRRRPAARGLAAAGIVLAGLALAPSTGTAYAEGDSLTNARAAAGLSALVPDVRLDEVAARHARAMAASGILSHMDLAAVSPVSDRQVRLGQNVGVGSSVEAVEATLLNSEQHRANILGDWDLLGTGVVVGNDGRVWMAQVFVKLAPLGGNAAVASGPPAQPSIGAAAPPARRASRAAAVRQWRHHATVPARRSTARH